MNERKRKFWFMLTKGNLMLVLILIRFNGLFAQQSSASPESTYTLDACIRYAFDNQPKVRQLQLAESIAGQDVNIAISDWLPQISSSASLTHYLKQPVMIFPNFNDPSAGKIKVTTGVANNSSIEFSARQVIFNNSVYIAGKTGKYYRRRARQNTREALIQLVINVSKSFYNVLLARQQHKIFTEEIDRLSKSLQDALALYENGTTDNIDYKRANISLNNARAQQMAAGEQVKSRLASLKELMGFPTDSALILAYDSAALLRNILIDTVQGPQYQNRIEYQLFQTNLVLSQSNVTYHKLSYLPSLSGFANYNLVYQNDKFSDLYDRSFPNSTIGLSLSFPIFEGNRRGYNLKKARLLYESAALDSVNLKQQISSEYTQAMAEYRSSLNAYYLSLENIRMAEEIYNTVKLQYNEGIKPYLEVIVSETDLRTARLNSLNALFVVLTSKLDVEKSLGKIPVNY